ncbi:acyl-[acyl-carrier-protein]--UDP-N-acetylglucosamine O-acyltransferase [Acidihalobacter yilgarnensis]|uniref:Acyl-[acyl-carrier-protein]--UDP-N-acetylglucosamine O-acyltransferase n=1 Tax=Acidihalobacter yilgarnensis TaxID=2819280 RepID=A0A1D8ITM3_9GAMM|nr:acyl-ACP--UDP-N-acetylglucosamine O-acyltransferase [Acidihalobacter yilgarnensis]AOU99674.1 acyl-[acyl-carrier-protein]--UDP-N-acetylglucosamine O-acyltransferase [Acidihalobacter yilgarnensis]
MIHPQAIIDSSAELAGDVTVGPFSVIGPNVTVDAGTYIGPHVVIEGPTRIGRDNRILQFASLGSDPQDKKYRGEPTELVIGDRNLIRESVTINRGTLNGNGRTLIGDDNLLMAYIHIAHDCRIGNNTIFSNNASLAGHVHIDDWVILSGFTLVHQFCSIGAHAFTGMGSAIAKDVPPYMIVSGNPAHPHGINKEGLKRRGFSPEQISQLRRAYKLLYRQGLTLDDALAELTVLATTEPAIRPLLDFLQKDVRRSIIR